MRSAEYPYPPDEFDAAAGAGGPRGVHRAPRSAWSRWWPFLVALVVVPAIAVAAVFVLSGWGDWPWSTDEKPAASAPADAGDEESPTDGESASSDASTPADDSSSTPAESTSSSAPAPAADLSRAVLVENATGTSGLAGGARDRLEAAGYTSVTTGNWKGTAPAASTVYYPAQADAGTAAAVAQQLGIAAVTLDATTAGDQVRVVLAADYTP